VKFGFHTQMNNWQHEISHAQLLDQIREQVQLCEALGFDAVWLPEHHLNPEGFGNSPNPILFAADLACRTQRITIGFACLTTTMWHPLRLAEDLALLDHLTKGRIEVGFGRGGRPSDTMPFNVMADPRNEDTNRELFTETIDVVVGAWTNRFFSHQGIHYAFPPKGQPHHLLHVAEEPHVVDGEVTKLMLVPKPYQQPHPPIWLMVSSERTARLAAEREYAAMAAGTPTDELRDYVDIYAEVRSSCEGRQVARGEGWAVSRPVHVASTMEEARKTFEIPVIRQREYQLNNRNAGVHVRRLYSDPAAAIPQRSERAWELLLERAMLAGPPAHVAEQVQELREVCGIENLITFMDAGGVPHDKIMQSLELFGTKVMPAFKAS
jgi:alkanesulfonate monooxygenase SsuD/methylene tetrahydromethanopterin reductase-like flavin-dependent oxidoreductase (luciferase family)